MRYGFLHSEDDGQPQGGEPSRASDMLDRYGRDALKLAEKLAEVQSDNYTLREKNRTLRQELKDAAAKAAPEGTRILTAGEAATYDAYAALGTPDALKQALDGAQQAMNELTSLRRDATLRDVRDATGYDLDVLRDIGGAEWQYRIADETADGEARKVVYVTDGDTERRIDEHPKVQRVLPALKPATAPPQPAGQAFPRQSSNSAPPTDLAARHIEQQEARRKAQRNPLMPQQGA